jgi:hypothetical protein
MTTRNLEMRLVITLVGSTLAILLAGCAASARPAPPLSTPGAVFPGEAFPGCFATPAPQPRRLPWEEGCSEAPAPRAVPVVQGVSMRSRMFHHVRYHQAFPAGRAEILAALRAAQEDTAGQREWVEAALPARTYASAADVMEALFGEVPRPLLASAR